MARVRLGIAGCGVIGRVHAASARKLSGLVDLAAVADVRLDAAQAVAAEYGAPRAYGTAEELLADPAVDAVVLALPAAARRGLAVQALQRGKHVLVEKPVAFNAREVEEMLAARGPLVAGCCSARSSCTEPARVAARFIESGALGKLRLLHCRAVLAGGPKPEKGLPPAWRLKKEMNGGGIMSNWGCYDLDFLFGLTRWALVPRQVLGRIWRIPPPFAGHVVPDSDAETHVAAFIQCADGVGISYERGEYMPLQTSQAWNVVGERGALRLLLFPKKGEKLLYDRADSGSGVVSETLWEAPPDFETHHHPNILEDFVRAVMEGRQPATSLERAHLLQRVTDAIYASAEQNQAMALSC